MPVFGNCLFRSAPDNPKVHNKPFGLLGKSIKIGQSKAPLTLKVLIIFILLYKINYKKTRVMNYVCVYKKIFLPNGQDDYISDWINGFCAGCQFSVSR